MRTNLKHCIWVVTVAVGIGLSGGTVTALGSPFIDDHDQDYSKNKTYQQGMREGKNDQAHNRVQSKKRHFKKDEDKKAYDAGYQKGRN